MNDEIGRITAVLYDGKTSKCVDCTLIFYQDGTVSVNGNAAVETYAFEQLDVSSRVGNTERRLTLPTGCYVESKHNDVIDKVVATLKPKSKLKIAHLWESNLGIIIGSAVLVVLATGLAVIWGIPTASEKIAHELPASVSITLADESLAQLDKYFFDPSTLPAERQRELKNLFQAHVPQESPFKFTLYFRDSPKIGANALALPEGTIVMTDQLVALAEHDEEILSILLHEMGHVEHRHGLRSVIESAGIYMMVAGIVGDLELASELLIGAAPVLVGLTYSRNHEREADLYSLEKMLAQGIDPIHFATIMSKLEHSHQSQHSAVESESGEQSDESLNDVDENEREPSTFEKTVMEYLSTHPPTPERVQRFEQASIRFNAGLER